MKDGMHSVDQAFVRECLRSYHGVLGYENKTDLIQLLTSEFDIPKEAAGKYVYRNTFDDHWNEACRAGVSILARHRDTIVKHLEDDNGAAAASYLSQIITRHLAGAAERRAPISDIIARNWGHTSTAGRRHLEPGVYQMFRRYKPWFPNGTAEVDGPLSPKDQTLICELMYIDSEAMEGVLVTSEGSVYWGSFHINHDDILYGIFQRPRDGQPGTLHRFYAVRITRSGTSDVYSALYMKSGDTSFRPISGETVFHLVPRSAEHRALWKGMKSLFDSQFEFREVPAHSRIMDYVSSAKGSGADGPIRIGDVPLISSLVSPEIGPALFLEPSRAVDVDHLEAQARKNPLEVFDRKSRAAPKKKSVAAGLT